MRYIQKHPPSEIGRAAKFGFRDHLGSSPSRSLARISLCSAESSTKRNKHYTEQGLVAHCSSQELLGSGRAITSARYPSPAS